MNIKEAKIQISNAMKAYLSKNEIGEYDISVEKQRPVFLMGPPGIGKTAIMEQIASELGVALVSYSMTHHTRQSALGLPFIVNKTYGGKEYAVSEYTMSEIIASVYEMIEKSGKKEGILFLDEINCVSETLAPAMLQFLQYKIFGKHSVPEGWIVVTAGNPMEYNNSARDFDIVTWDRLKRIDVEPDYEAWREFSANAGVHPSILSYIHEKKDEFYKIESTVDGKSFVTARGWTDLSTMISVYEKNALPIDFKLISQYIQNPAIAKSFSLYFELYKKYKAKYKVDEILAGKFNDNLFSQLSNAQFDEHVALLSILLDALRQEAKEVYLEKCALERMVDNMKRFIGMNKRKDAVSALNDLIKDNYETISKGKESSSVSKDSIYIETASNQFFEEFRKTIIENGVKEILAAVELLKNAFGEKQLLLRTNAKETGHKLSNAFKFIEKAIEKNVMNESDDMMYFITDVTLNKYISSFIGSYGCAEYSKYSRSLQLSERHQDIVRNIEILDIGEILNGNNA